jgi:hypothetical protein
LSIQAVAWVLENCDATLGARCLMFAIANHANEQGENAWAGVKTYAHEARISRTSTQKALRRLEEAGEIEATGTTRRGTTIYRIVGMGGLTKLAPPTSGSEGANLSTGGGQPRTSGGPKQVGPNRQKETSKEPSTPTAAFLPTPEEEVFNHWREVFSKNGNTALDGTRKRKIQARLDEGLTVDELKRAIDGCAASDYHMKRGKSARRDGPVYDELRMILRDRPQVEKMIGFAGSVRDRPDNSAYDATEN